MAITLATIINKFATEGASGLPAREWYPRKYINTKVNMPAVGTTMTVFVAVPTSGNVYKLEGKVTFAEGAPVDEEEDEARGEGLIKLTSPDGYKFSLQTNGLSFSEEFSADVSPDQLAANVVTKNNNDWDNDSAALVNGGGLFAFSHIAAASML